MNDSLIIHRNSLHGANIDKAMLLFLKSISLQVLCSVSDVNASVKEMRRVLKPEGKVYFLEHIFASEDKKLIQFGQKILNPVQQLLADGCHLTRNPLKAFQMAGFENLQTQTFQVPGLGVLSPHISGIATA